MTANRMNGPALTLRRDRVGAAATNAGTAGFF